MNRTFRGARVTLVGYPESRCSSSDLNSERVIRRGRLLEAITSPRGPEFTSDYLAEQGDSGGGVFCDGLLIGIHNGRFDDGTACACDPAAIRSFIESVRVGR
jgi:hypothetical protein